LPTPVEKRIMIRRAEPADLPGIMEIERVSFPTPFSEASYEAEMGREISVFLVVEEAGRIAGYIFAWAVVFEGDVLKIAVAPERRRQGLGKLLMEALEQEFVRRGVKEMWLEVRENNQAARSFYLGLGFCEVVVRHGYYTDTGEDAVVMMRRAGP